MLQHSTMTVLVRQKRNTIVCAIWRAPKLEREVNALKSPSKHITEETVQLQSLYRMKEKLMAQRLINITNRHQNSSFGRTMHKIVFQPIQ